LHRYQSLPVSLRVSKRVHHCLRPLLKPSPPLLPVQFTQSSLRTTATPIVCSFYAVTSSAFSFPFIPRTSACRVPEPYQSYPTSPPTTPAAHSAIPYSTTLTSLLAIRSSESPLTSSIYCSCRLLTAVTTCSPSLPTVSASAASASASASTSAASTAASAAVYRC
jgi:hypothetical protein